MFSVIIPYYKKRDYIERCIESVLSQTFKDFEIILVDDGSGDDISTFCKENYNDRIKLISQKNQGVSIARNNGIANAKNKYIAFLDADDYWAPFYLEQNHIVLTNEADVKIIGSNYTRNKNDLKEHSGLLRYNIIENYFSKQLLKSTLFFTSATIISRNFFMKNSGFNSELKRGEDLDVWFRAIASGGKAIYITNKLVYYSDEDVLQATQTAGKIEDSILYHYKKIFSNLLDTNANFSRSISKFLYLNLYTYYFSENNKEKSKAILRDIPSKSIWMQLPYFLPFFLGKKLLSTRQGKVRVRQYLKFVAQHLS